MPLLPFAFLFFELTTSENEKSGKLVSLGTKITLCFSHPVCQHVRNGFICSRTICMGAIAWLSDPSDPIVYFNSGALACLEKRKMGWHPLCGNRSDHQHTDLPPQLPPHRIHMDGTFHCARHQHSIYDGRSPFYYQWLPQKEIKKFQNKKTGLKPVFLFLHQLLQQSFQVDLLRNNRF